MIINNQINKQGRTIFIGDIHGCYDEFKLLLEKINLEIEDKVYIVGDMINKGPKSYKVLKFLYKNKQQFLCIKGNHEINFLRLLDGNIEKRSEKSIKNMNKMLDKIKQKNSLYLIDFIKGLPLYIEEKDFIMLHGGLIPGKNIYEHTEDEITRLREYNGSLWYKQYVGNKKIIYGHNAIDGLQIREKTIGLDSGCVYGKSLTAYILETGEVYSENALENYINI